MRTFVVWLGLLALGQTCLAADNDKPDLKCLYDAHRWFALRDAVRKTDAPLFYRGAVACVFNDVRQCEKNFKAVIGSQPRSEQAHAAHSLLAAVYLRYGQYRKALSQVDGMLVLEPDDSDAKSVRPLLAALNRSPDQSIGRRHSSPREHTITDQAFAHVLTECDEHLADHIVADTKPMSRVIPHDWSFAVAKTMMQSFSFGISLGTVGQYGVG